MDNKDILNDENLDQLGCIKECDLFSIVDNEFDKKREKKRVRKIIGISTLIIIFISLSVCMTFIMSKVQVPNKKIPDISKLLLVYYFISLTTMMVLIIPIKKRKKSY